MALKSLFQCRAPYLNIFVAHFEFFLDPYIVKQYFHKKRNDNKNRIKGQLYGVVTGEFGVKFRVMLLWR